MCWVMSLDGGGQRSRLSSFSCDAVADKLQMGEHAREQVLAVD